MVICKHCRHENHDDVTYCVQCGNWLGPIVQKKSAFERIYEKVPLIKKIRESETGYILLLLCGLSMLLLISIGMATIEGFASMFFLIVGIIAFRIITGKPVSSFKKLIMNSLVGIFIFAFMGACLDQPGNFIYNKPLDYISCPRDTHVQRATIVSNPLPESTYFIQNYSCFNDKGELVHEINLLLVLIMRFAEYLLLAFLMLGTRWLIMRIKSAVAT